MRIDEIIIENNIVKNSKKPFRDYEMAIPAAHRVAGTADRHYDLNRVMMAVAVADGNVRPCIPSQSWAGRNNIATPYSKIESEMLKHAYSAVGVEWDDALKPNANEKSLESEHVNKVSPVAKKKKNKYGV